MLVYRSKITRRNCLMCGNNSRNNVKLTFYDIFSTLIRAKYVSEYIDELFDIQVFENGYIGSRIICNMCMEILDSFIELKRIAYSSNVYFDKNAPQIYYQNINFNKQDSIQMPSTSSSSGKPINTSVIEVIDLCDSSDDH